MNDYDDWDEDHELMMVGGIGSVQTICPIPPKGRKKIMKRPIGFNTNLDELEPADE